MKKTTLGKLLAVGCGMIAVTAMAQTSTTVTTRDAAAGTAVTETSTTTAAGEFVTYAPGTDYFTFRAGTTGAPVRYYYNNDAHVFDPEGHPVSWSVIRPDTPATVYYAREGDRMIVRKVVLTRAPGVVEKQTTTTTTVTNEKEKRAKTNEKERD